MNSIHLATRQYITADSENEMSLEQWTGPKLCHIQYRDFWHTNQLRCGTRLVLENKDVGTVDKSRNNPPRHEWTSGAGGQNYTNSRRQPMTADWIELKTQEREYSPCRSCHFVTDVYHKHLCVTAWHVCQVCFLMHVQRCTRSVNQTVLHRIYSPMVKKQRSIKHVLWHKHTRARTTNTRTHTNIYICTEVKNSV